jgi:hypothetical protein
MTLPLSSQRGGRNPSGHAQTAAPFTMLHKPPFSQGLGAQLEFFSIGTAEEKRQHIALNIIEMYSEQSSPARVLNSTYSAKLTVNITYFPTPTLGTLAHPFR